jgi:hypothetical protein
MNNENKIKLELERNVSIIIDGEVYGGAFVTSDVYVFESDLSISFSKDTTVEIDDEECNFVGITFLGNNKFAIQVNWE